MARRESQVRTAKCPKVTKRNSRSLWVRINVPTSRRRIVRIDRCGPRYLSFNPPSGSGMIAAAIKAFAPA